MQKRARFVLLGLAATLLLTARAGAQGCGGMGRGTLLAQPSASASPDAKAKSKRLVARLWHGRTLTAKADAYEKYLDETGVKKILATDGNHGVEVPARRRPEDRLHRHLLLGIARRREALRGRRLPEGRHHAA